MKKNKTTIKYFLPIALLAILFICSCQNEDRPYTLIVNSSFHGTVYDSQTGTVLPGKPVRFLLRTQYEIISQQEVITDENGFFTIEYSRIAGERAPTGDMPVNYYGRVTTSFNDQAGYNYFDNINYSVPSELQLDIQVRPNGYYSLTLIDTSGAQYYWTYFYNSVVDNLSLPWNYDAQANNYNDTTRCFTIYGNTSIRFGLNGTSYGPFIPAYDTIYDTCYF